MRVSAILVVLAPLLSTLQFNAHATPIDIQHEVLAAPVIEPTGNLTTRSCNTQYIREGNRDPNACRRSDQVYICQSQHACQVQVNQAANAYTLLCGTSSPVMKAHMFVQP
jgi:hypothetical protein